MPVHFGLPFAAAAACGALQDCESGEQKDSPNSRRNQPGAAAENNDDEEEGDRVYQSNGTEAQQVGKQKHGRRASFMNSSTISCTAAASTAAPLFSSRSPKKQTISNLHIYR